MDVDMITIELSKKAKVHLYDDKSVGIENQDGLVILTECEATQLSRVLDGEDRYIESFLLKEVKEDV